MCTRSNTKIFFSRNTNPAIPPALHLLIVRKLYSCILFLYIPFIITVVFLFPTRERFAKNYEYHFIPLQNILAQIKDPAQYTTPGYWRIFAEGLAGNFLLFVPVGFFLRFFISRKNFILLLYGLALSVSIELTQLIFHLGVCDIDDVLLNTLGALTGIVVCDLLHSRDNKSAQRAIRKE